MYEFIDVNNDDKINGEDRTFIFNSGRQYFGGLVNTITFKSLEFSALLQFVKQTSKMYATDVPGQRTNLPSHVYEDRWKTAGDVATTQMISMGAAVFTPYSNYVNSNARLEDASFLRMKTLSISYYLPENSIGKIGLQECKLYLQGQNLFTVTDFTGLDPETGSDNIPPLKIMTFGIQLKL